MVELGTATNLENLGLSVGTPDIASVGPLAFGPQGVLFIADNVSARTYLPLTWQTPTTALHRTSTWTTLTLPWRPIWAARGTTWPSATWPCILRPTTSIFP